MVLNEFAKSLYFSSLQAVESTNGEVHVLQFLVEELTHTEDLLVECVAVLLGLLFENDTLVGEEHEVVDQDLSGFGECLLRCDGAVSSDFDRQFLVVGTLLDTELVNRDHDVADRCVDRIDSEGTDRIVLLTILITGHIATSFVDGDLNLKVGRFIEFSQLEFGVEYLEVLENGIELTGEESFLLVDMELNRFGLLVDALFMQEAHLFEVENKVGNVSDYTGDRSKFMINTTDLDRADSVTFEAAEQHTTDGVAYRNSVPRFEWAKLKDTFVRTRIQHYHLVRFDEI